MRLHWPCFFFALTVRRVSVCWLRRWFARARVLHVCARWFCAVILGCTLICQGCVDLDVVLSRRKEVGAAFSTAYPRILSTEVRQDRGWASRWRSCGEGVSFRDGHFLGVFVFGLDCIEVASRGRVGLCRAVVACPLVEILLIWPCFCLPRSGRVQGRGADGSQTRLEAVSGRRPPTPCGG